MCKTSPAPFSSCPCPFACSAYCIVVRHDEHRQIPLLQACTYMPHAGKRPSQASRTFIGRWRQAARGALNGSAYSALSARADAAYGEQFTPHALSPRTWLRFTIRFAWISARASRSDCPARATGLRDFAALAGLEPAHSGISARNSTVEQKSHIQT